MSISESFSSVVRLKKRKLSGYVSAATLLVALSSAIPDKSYALRLGDNFPDFPAISTKGDFKLHQLIDEEQKYIIFFSHPLDFTPVCTTELAAVHNLKADFDQENAIAIGFSVDTLARHEQWQKDILTHANSKDEELNFRLVSDETLEIAKLLDLLPADAQTGAERTAKDNKTARTVFIIGPDKTIRMMMTYPMTAGRNFDEILRVLRAIKLTDEREVATGEGWEPGDDIVVLPGMSQSDAEAKFKNVGTMTLPSGETYLRFATLPEDDDAEEFEVPLENEQDKVAEEDEKEKSEL